MFADPKTNPEIWAAVAVGPTACCRTGTGYHGGIEDDDDDLGTGYAQTYSSSRWPCPSRAASYDPADGETKKSLILCRSRDPTKGVQSVPRYRVNNIGNMKKCFEKYIKTYLM